jgi:hypothetical protein
MVMLVMLAVPLFWLCGRESTSELVGMGEGEDFFTSAHISGSRSHASTRYFSPSASLPLL